MYHASPLEFEADFSGALRSIIDLSNIASGHLYTPYGYNICRRSGSNNNSHGSGKDNVCLGMYSRLLYSSHGVMSQLPDYAVVPPQQQRRSVYPRGTTSLRAQVTAPEQIVSKSS
jgi:hypothetical protein